MCYKVIQYKKCRIRRSALDFRQSNARYERLSAKSARGDFRCKSSYISFPLGSLGPIRYIWRCSWHVYARGSKQCCKRHYCLWRASIKPRLPFSYLWCILCFQRQSFWRFIFFSTDRSRIFLYYNYSLFVHWWFQMWRLFCHYLFLISPIFGASAVLRDCGIITKTCLFKYTENFTTKTWKISDKNFWYFSYFCSKHRL